MQPPKPPPVFWRIGVIEASYEDPHVHVLVLLQEPDHSIHTVTTGAPGHVPGDTVFLTRGQLLVQELLVAEPRDEAEFCMASLLGIKLGEMGKEGKGTLWAGPAGTSQGEVVWGRREGPRGLLCTDLLLPISPFPSVCT